MVLDYKYEFRDAKLIKVDPYGLPLVGGGARDPTITETHTLSADFSKRSTKDTLNEAVVSRFQSLPGEENSRASERLDNITSELNGKAIDEAEDTEYNSIPTQTTPEENVQADPQTPGKQILTEKDLEIRDQKAVAYTKALLTEGDTLVYIIYPNESRCFDSTGFELSSAPQRVHSSRLLATGSSVFAKLLSPTNQYRTLRRKKLVGRLPIGVHYVLDLTPPDEGDAAVELISDLSCSFGIRNWYQSQQLCNVPGYLVGGEDEVIAVDSVSSCNGLTEATSKNFPVSDPNKSEATTQTVDWQNNISEDLKNDTSTAIKSSKVAGVPCSSRELKVLEYCPVRHRAGIARLLQVLEGKDPQLDSAPKVWTLFALSKFFDCTSAVVDWIITWMLGGANTSFIEILPEVSCKIAFGLKNQLLCRAAFSILVSEEAMSLASRGIHKNLADIAKTNQFGRIREDIDEDLRTRIEYASKNFHSRVIQTFDSLVEPHLPWFTVLPEYQKLRKFENAFSTDIGIEEWPKHWLTSVHKLFKALESYIRERLNNSLTSSISYEEGVIGDQHRAAEQYTLNAPKPKFSLQYDGLSRDERLFTRHFWKKVLAIDLPSSYKPSVRARWEDAASSHSDEKYSSGYSALRDLANQVNEALIEAINAGYVNNGMMPLEAFHISVEDDLRGSVAALISGAEDDIGQEIKKYRRIEPIDPGQEASEPLRTSPLEALASKVRNRIVPSDRKYSFASWNPFIAMPSIATEAHRPGQRCDGNNGVVCHACAEMEPGLLSEKKTAETDELDNVQNCTKINLAEFLAQHHLLDSSARLYPDMNSVNTEDSERVPLLKQTELPLRPRMTLSNFQDETQNASSQNITGKIPPLPISSSNIGSVFRNHYNWPDENWETSKTEISCDMNRSSNAGSNDKQPLERIYSKSSKRKSVDTKPTLENKPCIPNDYDILDSSPFFSMTKLFLEAKDHLRKCATIMLDTREIAFDVSNTDTILSLGQEEFKYLPLWAGGDDDDSGGVFDDAIPMALAGPNGPGPSFHTGFSSASQSSSEFDTMSERTSLDTSIVVEDGFSDHIDRRLVLADDDFHSETFSENSEVYDRKGKGVDRRGFYTRSTSSGVAFSTTGSAFDEVVNATVTDNIDIEYLVDENDDEDDVDTTVGQADDIGHDNDWDTGDDEAFDFGDGDSDEEMVEI